MSLHDMYFSKKNKNYIFSVLQDLILKQTGYNIDHNEDYIDLYRVKYPLIFDRNNSDNLGDLNKILIDEIGSLFINDINTKYKDKDIKIKDSDPPNSNMEIKTNPIDNIKKESEKVLRESYINSSERLSESLNRYDYTVELKDFINEISIKEITLPEENNIIFNNPLICLIIKTKNETYQIYSKLKEKLELNGKIYNTYYPLKEFTIPCDNKLKIEIMNNNLENYKTKDKILIQKIKEVNYNDRKYLGILLKDKHDLEINNSIGIYCDNKLINTFIVEENGGNSVLIKPPKFNYDKNKEYFLLNMNLQNNILINYSLNN